MLFLKKSAALFIVFILLLTNMVVLGAEQITLEKENSLTLTSGGAYLTATSDKYLFAATGSSAKLAYEISVYDKETLEFLTSITASSPSTVYLNVNCIYVKGDYLYAAFVQRSGNGNPMVCKYNIKEIYKGQKISAQKGVGMRPKAYSFMNDDIVCRADSGYGNITFMNIDELDDMSAIGISSGNANLLKSYTKLYISNNILYALYNRNVYMYDATAPLSGISKQDRNVFVGYMTPGSSAISNIVGFGNYIYCATTEGVYTVDMTNPKAPSNKGVISNTKSATAMAVNNGYLYIANSSGIKVYSLADGGAPALLYSTSVDSTIYSLHFRPGKIYAGTKTGLAIYNVSGVEIAETTVPGSAADVGEIAYKENLSGVSDVEKICADKNYLFTLNKDKNEVSVYKKDTAECVNTISKTKDGEKLIVSDMYVDGEYLYISYDSDFRRYLISEMESEVNELLPIPLYSDMTRDIANHVAQTDKYIFVAAADNANRDLLANAKILVYDKKTKDFITSIHMDSGNANYDLAVRNMYAVGNKLYVTYNNVKTATNYSGSLSAVVNGNTRYNSPLCFYNVESIAKDAVLSPTIVCANAEIPNISHPYNRGGNSYFDEDERKLYQGIYKASGSQSYNVYSLETDSPSLSLTLANGSKDCVYFAAGNGYFYEILQNNGGLTLSGTTTQSYNKVLLYDITNKDGATSIDLSERLVGTYQTEVYGDNVIFDVCASNEFIFAATTAGLEVIDKNTLKKVSSVLDGTFIHSVEIKDSMLFVSSAKGVHIYSLDDEITLLSEQVLNTHVYDLDVNTEEKKVYITYKKNSGYGAVMSYGTPGEAMVLENLPVLKNIDKNSASLSQTIWSANSGHMILENDKYIFAVVSKHTFTSCSVVQIYDKKSGALLAELSETTANVNRYRPIRNMHIYDDVLYVVWGNGYEPGDANAYVLGQTMSPVKAYDVSNVTAGVAPTGITVFTGGQRNSDHAPYILGNISYMDAENGKMYFSEVQRKNYNSRYYYIYDLKALNAAVKAGSLSGITKKAFSVGATNMNAVEFIVKDGYLYQILQNKAGLSSYNCSATLTDSTGKVLNNTVRIYDLNGVLDGLTSSVQSVESCYRGMYRTEQTGDNAIKDIEVFGNTLYAATTSGVEVVDVAPIKAEGVTSSTAVTLSKKKLLTGDGGASELKVRGNRLYASFYGPQVNGAPNLASGNGGVAVYDLAQTPDTPALTEYQSIPYGVCDFSVNAEERAIYMMQDTQSPPSMTAYKYNASSKMFETDSSEVILTSPDLCVLDNVDTYKSAISGNHILITAGVSAEEIDKILVCSASTNLKVCEITVDSGDVSNLFINGNYFYTFSGKTLNCYAVSQANSNLSDCLKGTYEATGDINAICEANGKLYLATEDGLELINVSAITAGTATKYKTVYEGEKIKTLSCVGNYVYGASDAGKLFIYDAVSFSIDAEQTTEGENGITEIAVSENDIFCLLESGEVAHYESNEGVVIEYDVKVETPKAKKLTGTSHISGFPDIAYRERIYSAHSKVCANDSFVVTGGAGGITVYTNNMEEIESVSYSNVSNLYLNGKMLLITADSNVVLYDLTKVREEGMKEIFKVSGKLSAGDKDSIWVYDSTSSALVNYSYSGEILKTFVNCTEAIQKMYICDGYLYAVNDKILKLYDLAAEDGTAFADTYKGQLSTVQKITDIETKGDYLYVSTYGGNAGSNKLWVYNTKTSKTGETTDITYISGYSTSTSEQGGGKITAIEKAGDYLIVDAVDDSEIQVVSIKSSDTPFIESKLKKSKEDSYNFSDIAVTTDRVYAINEGGGLVIYDYNSLDISEIEFVSGGNTTFVPTGSEIGAKVHIYNESGSTKEGVLYLAVYEEGRLKSVLAEPAVIENGKETVIETESIGKVNSGNAQVKAMLFEAETQKALCDFSVPLVSSVNEDITFYVDASADEQKADGSKAAPFKTISDAKEAVRAVNKQMTSDITVVIKGGRYELEEPVVFDERDSGFNGYSVIYKAEEGEKPVISGGKIISGWTLYDSEKGIYQADSHGINTRQLYVDGKNAQRARSKGGLINPSTDGGKLGIYCYNPEIADYKNIKDLELVFIGSFLSKRIALDAAYKLDSKGRTLLVMNKPFWDYPNSFNSYIPPVYYENALELLDEENEFYIDSEEEKIYYKPIEGKEINSSLICAPALEELVVLKGSGYYDKVENVEFRGLTFSDTTWMAPTNDGGFYPTQAGHKILPTYNSTTLNSNMTTDAFVIDKCENITLKSCVLQNIGGNAIGVTDSAYVNIQGNKIYDVSAGGIYVGSIEKVDANPSDYRKAVHNIKIENNYLKDIATEYYSSCAIALGAVFNTEVMHNEIINTPYTGIHIGWGWDSSPKRNITGLKVMYNHITDTMQLLGDGGAIYTTGYTLADSTENPNMIAENHIERVEGNTVFSGAAIYLDTGSSGYKISKNVVDLTESESAWVPKWSAGGTTNIFDGNFSSTVNGVSHAINTTVSETAQWNDEATAIINMAGLTEEYKYLMQ